MSTMKLYHRISDPSCALVRRALTEKGLTDEVQFRNIDASASALEELQALTGKTKEEVRVPALQVGPHLFLGEDEILKELSQLQP